MIRILFLADTHLGFDYPFRPKIKRRRRGHDFFRNYHTALEPALNDKIDLVIHGGDILYRSKVPAKLVEMAFEPLKDVADRNVPVYIVPGNHERSAIPYELLAAHPEIHIFDKPRTFFFKKGNFTLALAGFPYFRGGIRKNFINLTEKTGLMKVGSDSNVLCIHQCVEGAKVGLHNYTFRYNPDVIKAADISGDLAAVLSGHIHRYQVLKKDLSGNPLSVPVLYPGSIERTSFAEKNEQKGYLIITLETEGPKKGKISNVKFCELPARPMVQIDLNAENMEVPALKTILKNKLAQIDRNSVVKIRISGKLTEDMFKILSAGSVRSISNPNMNVCVSLVDYYGSNFSRKNFSGRNKEE